MSDEPKTPSLSVERLDTAILAARANAYVPHTIALIDEIGSAWHAIRSGVILQALGTEEGGLRPEVVAFAHLMEAQLRANDHKPGWKGEAPEPLMDRLIEEYGELADLFEPGSRSAWGIWKERVGAEAADVANFALMIADVCGALPAPSEALGGKS